MKSISHLLITFLIVASSSLLSAAGNDRPAKPNVILLLTDDLGWQDVKCYDIDEPSPMETPNIDALAKKGVMFWQAYSPAPTCAPSRAAIMTGIHPARAQYTHVVGGAPPAPFSQVGRMMPPWYRGSLPSEAVTIAEALKENGYTTGHCGKWHLSKKHDSAPQPEDQGFDWTRRNIGVTARMRPHRLTGFATDKESDEYRIDENGFATHQNSLDAITFVEEHKENPFFLFYATKLVHTPIHTRTERLLKKYCDKLGVELPENPQEWKSKGQTNPFYCAMVEELDYYVGQLFKTLETTEDPRWPGHMLIENTYIIFTSDNGGMEAMPNEVITDNYPLARGKISAMEGGTRVPLIITGPGIAPNKQSNVMVNGLDFFPTILTWTGTEQPKEVTFDGCNLSNLLKNAPSDPELVKQTDGLTRDSMMWHFPNSIALESTIRIGNYKLIHNYDHLHNDDTDEFELYQLYKGSGKEQTRVDIEESKNLISDMPEKAQNMKAELTRRLSSMKASYPHYNPNSKLPLPHQESTPNVLSHKKAGKKVTFYYQENGAKISQANLLYTLNGGEKSEEWFSTPANIPSKSVITAALPEGTTHYLINLIDEHNFLVTYPEIDKATRTTNSSPKALNAAE